MDDSQPPVALLEELPDAGGTTPPDQALRQIIAIGRKRHSEHYAGERC